MRANQYREYIIWHEAFLFYEGVSDVNEKKLLDNGIYKIETLALDDTNDLICFYEDKDGTITDDGYLFNELSNIVII